jgi:hypothetical protein
MKSPLAMSALGLALLTAACGDRSASARAKADSSLARDLALASSQATQPTFQDTAVARAPAPAAQPREDAPAPVRTRVAERPRPQQPVVETPAPQTAPTVIPQATVPAAAPAAVRREIAAGSAAELTGGSKVCTSSNLPGDKIVATLNTPLVGENGAEIPAGSTVVLEVASLNAGETAEDARITFRVRSIVVNDKTYSVGAEASNMSTLSRTKVGNGDANADKRKVAGGAIAGAILGQMIGHSTKGTVIGAAAGAAAAAASVKANEKWEACLPAGSQIRLKLNEAIVIS